MTRNPLLGLATRWAREHLSTDHHARARIAGIEWEARQQAQEQLGQVLLPGLHRRNTEAAARREAAAAAREDARRAAMAPVGDAGLRLTGDLDLVLGDVVVDVELEDGVLRVVVEPAVAGWRFQQLALAVAGYDGPGRHDLRDVDPDDVDPLDVLLVVDDEAEPFCPDLDAGPCTIEVRADGIAVDIAWVDAGSRRVRLVGVLPVALPAPHAAAGQ